MQQESARRLVRIVMMVSAVCVLVAREAYATEETVLFLEENRVAAEKPLELHTDATTATWIDFVVGTQSKFRIHFNPAGPTLAILNAQGNAIFSLGANAVSFDQDLALPAYGITGAGPGSGLNADQVDGVHASGFLRADQSSTLTAGTLSIASGTTLAVSGALSLPSTGISGAGSGSSLNADMVDSYHGSALFALNENELVTGIPSFNGGTSGSSAPFSVDSNSLVSSLNADQVDGLHATSFLRSDQSTVWNDSATAGVTLRMEGNTKQNLFVVNTPTDKICVDCTTGPALLNVGDSGTSTSSAVVAIADGVTLNKTAQANTVGIYGAADGTTSNVKLGSSGPTVTGKTGMLGINAPDPSAPLEVCGGSQQLRLSYSTNPANNYASFTAGPGGELTVAPKGNLVLNVGGGSVYPSTPYGADLGTSTHPFRELHAGGIVAALLNPIETFITSNERMIVGSGTELMAAVDATQQGWTVKHAGMVIGDFLFLQSPGAGGLPQFEVVQVTANPTQVDPNDVAAGYSISVQRNVDGSGGNVWAASNGIFNLGHNVGDGWLDLYSRRSIFDVVTQDPNMHQEGSTMLAAARKSGTWNDWNERAAFGNLDGLFHYSGDTYGFAAGDPAAAWISADPNEGFRIMHGTEERGHWFSNGDVLFGNVDPGKGNLFWRNSDSDLLLRQGAVPHVQLDATTGNVFVGENVSAPATTRFAVFSANTAYNGETLESGDLLLGSNSAGQGNLWWDESSDSLFLRTGTNQKIQATSTGNLYLGRQLEAGHTQSFMSFFGASTTWGPETLDTGDVLLNNTGSNNAEGNLLWDQSDARLLLRVGTTPKLRIDSDGDFFVGGTAGAVDTNYFAVFATQQAFGGETRKPGDILLGQYDTSSKGNLLWDANDPSLNIRMGTTKKFRVESDGDVFIGSNAGTAAGTGVAIFSNASAQTYNGEAGFSTGDILLGDNSSGKANVFYDSSAGRLNFRGGQGASATKAYIAGDGSLTAGNGKVLINDSGITIQQGGSGLDQIHWLDDPPSSAEMAYIDGSGYGDLSFSKSAVNIVAVDTPQKQGSLVQLLASDAGGSSALYVSNSPNGWFQKELTLLIDGVWRFKVTPTASYFMTNLGIQTNSPQATLDVRGSAIFNEDAGNNDFRIEGQTQPNLFFAKASTDKIGIGTNAPSTQLDVANGGTTNRSVVTIKSGSGTTPTAGDMLFVGTGVPPANGGNYNLLHAAVGAGYATEVLALNGSGKLFLNDNSNQNMTQGLTVNQGANDDEILALKSSDVNHGLTDLVESDTFLKFQKDNAGTGGGSLSGWSAGTTAIGLRLSGIAASTDNTKSTSATGAVVIAGWEKDPGNIHNIKAPDPNENLLVVRSGLQARFILDAEGDAYHNTGTGWQNFDIFDDDVPLLNALAEGVSRPDNQIRQEFRGFLEKHREDLERLELVHFSPDGQHFVNMSRLTMLLTGAVRQLHARTERLEQRLEKIEGQLGQRSLGTAPIPEPR